MRTLITGGIKSGKSSRALSLAQEFPSPRTFVATAVGFDEEMQERIRRHREERGDRYLTIEEPIEIGHAARENMLLDCITIWVNNLVFQHREEEWDRIAGELIGRLGTNAVIVTNEVGLGNVPMDPATRRYNEMLARTNARIANAVDRVVFMVAGKPLVVSGPSL